MKNKFLILWLAGVVSTLLALPYIFTLQQDVIAKAALPLWQLGIIAVMQSAVLIAIAVFFGLKLADKIDARTEKLNAKNILTLSVPLGIAVALVIKFGDLFFIKSIPALAVASERIPFWKALLVAPYGGVVEELLMRLFLVSLFAWLLGKIFGVKDVIKNNVIMWVAILGASILFGLGHLPATATITPLTPLVITRAIILNGIGGVVFGWLYWKKGLPYAIIAHFTADIVLHAVLPALM